MVVKKFEARSMKEALEMIKAEMGPEAIIMAARDNSKRYGLVGEGSVEITAAIQPDKLQKKMRAESRLPVNLREKIHQAPARAHRELIEKSVARSAVPAAVSKEQALTSKPKGPITRQQRYIDIEDDVEPAAAPHGANDKLKVAAQNAWREMHSHKPLTMDPALQSLRGEIDSLRQIFKNFKDVPQSLVQGHPGSEHGLKYELASSFERLCSVGIATPIVVDILKQVQERLPEQAGKHTALINGLIAKALAQRLEVCAEAQTAKVEVFIGAGGHGKTSSLIKHAANLVLNEQKSVAILTTDLQKFGSTEQLKIYAQILNIPFVIISNHSQWETIAEEAVGFDKILVDTPGVRFRLQDEMQKLKELLPPGYLHPHVHLVISATSKDQDAIELGKRFSSIGFDDVIFTALDESFQHGVMINFHAAVGKPFHSFGTGPRVPEDFEAATKERIIDLLITNSGETPFSINIDL